MRDYQIDNLVQSGFALVIFGCMVWLIATALRRASERQHEIRLRLLERASTEDLLALFRSPEGREWLGRFLSGGLGAAELAGSTLQRGITLIGIGAASTLSAVWVRFTGGAALAVGGIVAVGWGIALLVTRWWLLRAAPPTPRPGMSPGTGDEPRP